MAKKAKLKTGSDEHHFEFPVFDEGKFVVHELEQSRATIVALTLTVALGAASWAVDWLHGLWFIPILLGLAVLVFTPYIVQLVRPASADYTKGEWAGLIMLEFFGWMGLWFLLLDLLKPV